MARLSDLREVTVACLLNGAPMPGAWAIVRVKMLRKNPFTSLHGPANDQGVVHVTGEHLLRLALEDLRFALMDYGSPEAEWSGEFAAEPVGRATSDRALGAYRRFHEVMAYPKDYGDGLARLRDALNRCDGESKLAVRILNVDPAGLYAVTGSAKPTTVVNG